MKFELIGGPLCGRWVEVGDDPTPTMRFADGEWIYEQVRIVKLNPQGDPYAQDVYIERQARAFYRKPENDGAT